SLAYGLALFYLVCFGLNAGFAAYHWFVSRNRSQAALWGVVAAVFLAHIALYVGSGLSGGSGPVLPHAARDVIDAAMGPITYTTISVVGFIAVLYWRRFFTQPVVALLMLNLSLLFAGWAMTEPNFRSIMTKPDNVPIPLLIYSVGFTTWLALRRAVINDERMAKCEPPLEKVEDEKVLVWPDLVYTELICMIICTAILIVWAIVLKAPLEAPATAAKAPNPSKAPWYFLGLQEMLVYYDPWMAGV